MFLGVRVDDSAYPKFAKRKSYDMDLFFRHRFNRLDRSLKSQKVMALVQIRRI